MTLAKLKVYAKGVVAFVLAVLVGAVAQGLISGATALWVNLVVGVGTTYGVVKVRNAPLPTKEPSP